MTQNGGPLGVTARLLVSLAAALVGGALAAAGSGLVSYVTAGTVALTAAALAAVSVMLNQPDPGRSTVPESGPGREPLPTRPASRPSATRHRHHHFHHNHHHSHQHQNDFPRPGHSPPGRGGADGSEGVPGTAGNRYRNRIRWAFALAVMFLGVEAVAALSSGSLTLLSDVGHVLADVVGLGMALAAIHLANAGTRHPSRTYGLYRVEIVAALANALLLMGMAGYVIVEAAFRFGHPEHVPGGTMVLVAVAGLIANLVSVWLLRPGASESLNVKGAYLDVVADAIGSVGLLVAGIVIRVTDAAWIDPLIGAALGLWILPRAVVLGREALRILVQAAPKHVDVAALEADLGAVDGVVDVHHLHIWTLTSDVEVASAHLRVAAGVDSNRVLVDARDVLHDRYHLTNVTLQVECAEGDGHCAGF